MTPWRFAAAVAAFLMLAALPVLAATDGTVSARRVIDGDTIVLNRAVYGSDRVRLVGIQAPELFSKGEGSGKWPLAGASKKALEALVAGKKLKLVFGGRRKDRYGRLLAHLITGDGVWVQGEMLKRGMAMVYSFPDNRSRVAGMLALERRARKAGLGIWGNAFYAVRKTGEALNHVGTFQLVEGRVRKATRVKGVLYLNFGEDWRTDFTVMIRAKGFRLFKKAGIDPISFQGRRIRVRGWIRKWNGPMIEATHPEQIEVLAGRKAR